MDSLAKIFLQRAGNELFAADSLKKITENASLKQDLELPSEITFYSRADTLLGIFKGEKSKRGNFTYETIPQANKEPAEDSLKNAKTFVSNIQKIAET